jgi:benzoate-CoA ligase family protein
MHRHADIRFVCESYATQLLGISADDVCLSAAKLFFAYGIGNSLFFPLSVGASTVLEPSRPNPQYYAELVARHGVTLYFGVPSFWGPTLAAELPRETFATVRNGVSAGEALPARMFQGVKERYGFEILDGIGSTEALHIFLSNRPGEVHPGASGRPVPGYDVRVVDDEGQDVADDTAGHLLVRGESLATGYWCRTALTRRTFLGEWMRTGDTYTRSADGVYTYCGRSDDMLKAGGIWVSPGEVESRLLEHPAVREAAVVGVPDENGLDKPVAVVVVGEGASERDLVAWCREGLAHFKAPRQVVFVTELPKTATGKLQRFKVRDLVSETPDPDPAAELEVAP